MKKHTIGLIIITLVFIFPFRWVYLEYTDPIASGATMIDSGRIKYAIFFLMTVAGFLAFMFLSTSDDTENH